MVVYDNTQYLYLNNKLCNFIYDLRLYEYNILWHDVSQQDWLYYSNNI